MKEDTTLPLRNSATNLVFGEGSPDAKLFFLGEGPGYWEDQKGRPFVGNAGALLNQLLYSIKLPREEVFITNVVCYRPPENRDPLPGEIQSCRKWLDRQVEAIGPKVVVTLGRYSMARYFPGETISKVHGKSRKVNGVIYFPMYHPAAALHQGGLRETIKADMLKIPELLAEAAKQEKAEAKQQPKQLGMF